MKNFHFNRRIWLALPVEPPARIGSCDCQKFLAQKRLHSAKIACSPVSSHLTGPARHTQPANGSNHCNLIVVGSLIANRAKIRRQSRAANRVEFGNSDFKANVSNASSADLNGLFKAADLRWIPFQVRSEKAERQNQRSIFFERSNWIETRSTHKIPNGELLKPTKMRFHRNVRRVSARLW